MRVQHTFMYISLPLFCNLLSKRTGAWNAKFHPGLQEGVDVHTDVWTIYQ